LPPPFLFGQCPKLTIDCAPVEMIRLALSISLDPLGRLTEFIETSDTSAVAGLQEPAHGLCQET